MATTSPADAISNAWREIAGAGFDHVPELLIGLYSEPGRHYHVAEHIAAVLTHIDALLAEPTEPADRHALIAAALFHDAIYDPRSKSNEADSAVLACEHLVALGWTAQRIADVAAMIVATAGHTARTPAEAVLLDADLAILGAPPADYNRYVQGVRAEYAFVPEEQWRTGRAAVLASFSERDRIFVTDGMAARREQQARDNIATELAELSS